MSRLRLGLIGAGSWAFASHLPVLARRAEEVEFVAVSGLDRELLDRARSEYGFAVASEDYRDVLAAGLDACVVSSPGGLHHEHARAAIEAGAHVLVEKPMTISPADAWELVELAAARERHLLVAFGWNYRPMVQAFHAALAAHEIGSIEMISIQMASATRQLLLGTGAYHDSAAAAPPERRTWIDPALAGGGYGQAQLSHALGLALWLSGLRGEAAFGLMGAPAGATVELHDAVAVRFRDGAIGTIAGTSAHTGVHGDEHLLELQVTGSAGQARIDLERELAWIWAEDGAYEANLEVAPGDGAYDCAGPPLALVDLALGREVENCSPGELGARTVELLDAIYRSARSGELEQVRSR
jgi:predicted dehydrogenase